METKIIYIDQKEAKRQARKMKFKAKLNKGIEWVTENKELIISVTPVIIGGAVTVVKVIGRCYNTRKTETVKNLYCYDRSLGHYWRLKRELTNREWLEIDSRKKNGERLADILSEMKVLK